MVPQTDVRVREVRPLVGRSRSRPDRCLPPEPLRDAPGSGDGAAPLPRRTEGEAAREAREVLLDLAGRDRRPYRLLIDRLRDRTRREPRGAELHLQLLAELLRSDRSPEPPPWPDLFLGWETVFSHPPTELWNPLVSSWLNAAAGDGTREMALGVMVGATHGRTAALHRLYAIACDWVGPRHHPSRAAVAALFWQHIDNAQYVRTESAKRAGAGPRTTEEAR